MMLRGLGTLRGLSGQTAENTVLDGLAVECRAGGSNGCRSFKAFHQTRKIHISIDKEDGVVGPVVTTGKLQRMLSGKLLHPLSRS